MKHVFFLSLLFPSLAAPICLRAQEVAQRRARLVGTGANLSFLEGYWNGTKAAHYGDYLTMSEVTKRQSSFRAMTALGMRTVRIPVCFQQGEDLRDISLNAVGPGLYLLRLYPAGSPPLVRKILRQ